MGMFREEVQEEVIIKWSELKFTLTAYLWYSKTPPS
jgi:hypothetical protein